jgi:hypothetical protein
MLCGAKARDIDQRSDEIAAEGLRNLRALSAKKQAQHKQQSQAVASTPASSEDLSAARDRALQQVAERPEELLTAYTQRFGNVLNADNAAELFPDYAASPDSRTQFRAAVHPAAQRIRDELFRRSLAKPDVREVVFTSGGTGAGKSAANLPGDVVMDSTLSNPEHSRGEIQSALDAGKQVQIVYIYRPIDEAMNAALDRAKENGRTVPIDVMLKTHEGAAKSIASLYDRHSSDPRVRFKFVDNSAGDPKLGTIDLARRQDYRKEADQLDAILESRRADVPEIIYQAARGGYMDQNSTGNPR